MTLPFPIVCALGHRWRQPRTSSEASAKGVGHIAPEVRNFPVSRLCASETHPTALLEVIEYKILDAETPTLVQIGPRLALLLP
jgi:hypothetical protein